MISNSLCQYLALFLSLYSITISLVSSQQTVAFTATKGERNGPYVSFKTLLANSSAKFNPLYGVFICTEPGLYFFSYNMISPQNSELRVSLRTNRIPVITSFSGSKTSFGTATGTAILQLEAEDIVYLFVEEGDFYESRQLNRAYTSFSGMRIGSAPGSDGGFFSSIIGRNANPMARSGNPKKQEIPEIDSKDNIFSLLNLPSNVTSARSSN